MLTFEYHMSQTSNSRYVHVVSVMWVL